MTTSEFYYTIDKPATTEFKDRGSKFIGCAFPINSVEDFKKRLEEIKKEHPKATHHCFAYRLGLDKNVFRVNDDGEPAGTAGKPILGQIDHKELTNTLIIVVRYFGGTLLGVPGLINAYKMTSSLVLQLIPVVQKTIEEKYTLHFDYTQINEVLMVVKQLNCSIIHQEMNLFCTLNLGIPKSKLHEALYRFGNVKNLEVKKI